ncbi:MAG TPA: MoaD/ThiS family protein [Chitinophagaceae bacterium]|nr:MoaD/ThiS family protein [Chitinophagaceae bacterium]
MVFGQLTEITGSATVALEGAADTDAVLRLLQTRYPRLTGSRYVVAVNKKIITENTKVGNTDAVALLPPFSGG